MKVTNMTSIRSGNPVANQFIINDDLGNRFFQSYNSIIVKQDSEGQTWLDNATWDYSVTTAKYRKEFLNEGVEATRAKIKNGEYKLTNLNEDK
tara:strand:- start:3946 stop:4224 length:279 start_codon:yes stop_codon:yes gene_type:complete